MSSYLSDTDMEEKSEPLIVKVETPNDDAGPDQITTPSPPNENHGFMIKIIESKCVRFVLVHVLLNLFFFILLVAATLITTSVCFLINAIIYVIDSAKGDAGKRKVVSPISPGPASLILLFVIIVSSTATLIPTGLQIAQWIRVFLVILGYLCLGTSAEFMVSNCCNLVQHKQWFRALLEATYGAILYPTVALMLKVAPILGDSVRFNWIGVAIIIIVGQNAIGLVAHAVVWSFRCRVKCSHELVQEYEREERELKDEEDAELKKLQDRLQIKRQNLSKKRAKKRREKCLKEIDELDEKKQRLTLRQEVSRKEWQQELDRKHRIKCNGPKCRFHRWKGLRRSITFVLVALTHLLTWVFYIRPHLTKEVSDLGIWTFLCELLMAVLWLLKDFILVSWQGNTLRDKKFRRKLTHWYCLYKLGLINLKRKLPDTEQIQPTEQKPWFTRIFLNPLVVNQDTKWKRKEDQWNEAIEKLEHLIANVQHQDDSCPVSIHDKEFFAQAFLPDCATFLPDDEEISNSMISSPVTQENVDMVNKFDKSAAGSIAADSFPTWTRRAYENCSQLQRLITSGHEVVNFLNKIMMGFIIALILIIWLRLTQVLPTQAILAVTSPILGATFIFGDTLKIMFQGFIFVYITHPFAIGDVCVINQTQLEVKEIGIWRTIFTKIGTKDQVVYPNSVLARSAIISYEGDTVDLNDFVEFGSDSTMDLEKIDILAKYIRQYISKGALEANKQLLNAQRHSKVLASNEIEEIDADHDQQLHNATRLSQVSASNEIEEIDADHGHQASINAHVDAFHQMFHNKVVVEVQQVQDNTKVIIHFKHEITILDRMSSAEASIEKMKRKSKILAYIANLLRKAPTLVQ